MGTRAGTPELRDAATVRPVYGAAGSYAPGFVANLRAAAWLAGSSAADIWHFVFAPNFRSSAVGRALKRLRRVPTVQTIASPPRSFADSDRLLFGDVVVAQSHWTKNRFAAAFRERGLEPPPIEVVFPPVSLQEVPASSAVRAERNRLGLKEEQPLFLYPGDLETSSGAVRTLAIAEAVGQKRPDAIFLLAYRGKTAGADACAERLRARVDPRRVLIERDVPDIVALLKAATAVVFPVDDLFGKVDLPIVLLEAMALKTPVLALDEGPLSDLQGAWLLPEALSNWTQACLSVTENRQRVEALGLAGREAAGTIFSAKNAAERYECIYRKLL